MKFCQIDEIGIDIPCPKRAKHTLEISKTKLGDHGSLRLRICDDHYKLLNDKGRMIDLLDKPDSGFTSTDYIATLRKNKL